MSTDSSPVAESIQGNLTPIIKEHVVWWESGSEPVELLKQRKVVMSSGYNGRFFDARVSYGLTLEIVWHGQFINYSTRGMSVSSPNKALAEQFILIATDTQDWLIRRNTSSMVPHVKVLQL